MSNLIVGQHSIVEAIKNPARGGFILWGTNDSLNDFKKKSKLLPAEIQKVKIIAKKNHEFQQHAKDLFKEEGFTYSRVASNLILEATELPAENITWIYKKLDAGKPVRLLCLDQVTDAHNGAAIMRTAAFFKIDAIIISYKGNFGHSPNFFRIASGATEHVKIINCGSLPKNISKLSQMGVKMIGLSEHADNSLVENTLEGPVCLVLGAEDVGISNALGRVINNNMALVAQGPIKSLNVSVAAAVAMEKLFGVN